VVKISGDRRRAGPDLAQVHRVSGATTRRPLRLTETAREAGATKPEQLGEQLALLLDGASARSRVLATETLATAAAIAAVLVDNAITTAAAT
jgi:hypothetical protein